MQDQYESRFGIFNHLEAVGRPLASVAMFPSEDATSRGLFYDALEEYADNNYKEIWGLTVSEFFDQPRYVVQMMRKITAQVRERKGAALSDLDQQMKNLGA